MESFEKENDRDIFGTTSKINSEKFDEIKEGSNLGGLESFNSLMQESKEIEVCNSIYAKFLTLFCNTILLYS